MIASLSLHQISRVVVEPQDGYSNMPGTYQRIRFFDENGLEKACLSIHAFKGTDLIPAFDSETKAEQYFLEQTADALTPL